MGEYRKKDKLDSPIPKEISILGTIYKIERIPYNDDAEFERQKINGYCDSTAKRIVVGDLATFKGYESATREERAIAEKTIARHEVIHAFFFESGLGYSSNSIDGPWAMNEEMVDWFAVQGPKIMKVWQEMDIIDI